MDLRKYAATDGSSFRLKRHCEAIRRNKDILAEVFNFLSEDPPNASAAKEAFDEIESHDDQTAIWSLSTTAGGIWERWERDALKYGELTDAYSIWQRRSLSRLAESG